MRTRKVAFEIYWPLLLSKLLGFTLLQILCICTLCYQSKVIKSLIKSRRNIFFFPSAQWLLFGIFVQEVTKTCMYWSQVKFWKKMSYHSNRLLKLIRKKCLIFFRFFTHCFKFIFGQKWPKAAIVSVQRDGVLRGR